MNFEKTSEKYVAETTLSATMLPDEPVVDKSGRKWLPERLTVIIPRTGPMEWRVLCRRVVRGNELGTSTKTITRYSSYDFHEGTLAALAADADKLAATAEPTPDEALSALQKHHDSFVEQIYRHMPECWEGDEDEALRFVASFFEPRGSASPGHSEDCDCF